MTRNLLVRRRDENGIIVWVKWCRWVSLGIKARCPLSLHGVEKILDGRDLIGKRPNESPLRHQPKKASKATSFHPTVTSDTAYTSVHLPAIVIVMELRRQ